MWFREKIRFKTNCGESLIPFRAIWCLCWLHIYLYIFFIYIYILFLQTNIEYFSPDSFSPTILKSVFEKCLRLQVEKWDRACPHNGLQARSLTCKTVTCFSGAVVLKQRVFLKEN